MPLYDYRCENCGHTFEATHAVGGTPGPCPVCGGHARRIFSSVGVIFKGSGFYSTDNRKSPSSDSDGAKTPASPSRSESSPSKASPPSKP
jgi:putative FmdB family regulatory protein